MDNINVPQVNECTAPTMPGEEWRPVTNDKFAVNTYWVSNIGRVWNAVKGRLISIHFDAAGYARVCLRSSDKDIGAVKERVHRLVAYAFLPAPKEDQIHVDHIDGNRANNHPENLRWCTVVENRANPITVQRMKAASKKKAIQAYVPVICIETGVIYPSVTAAAKAYDRKVHSIIENCKRSAPGEKHSKRSTWNGQPVVHFQYVQQDNNRQPVKTVVNTDPCHVNQPRAKQVMCLEDGSVYPTIHAAAEAYGLTYGAVSLSCNLYSAGKKQINHHGTKPVYHFRWYEHVEG